MNSAVNKARLVFVRLGTRAGVIGGGTVRLLNFSKLCKSFRIGVITHSVTYEWFRRIGISMERFFLVKKMWAWQQSFLAITYCMLYTILFFRQRARVEIVCAFSHYLHDVLIALWVHMITKAKLVIYVNSAPLPRREGRGLVRFIVLYLDHIVSIQIMKRRADMVFVFNQHDKFQLEHMEVSHVKVLKYGISKSGSTPTRLRDSWDFEAIYVGRITATKGAFDLVRVWQEVLKTVSNARLIMVGPCNSSEEHRLKNTIEKANLTSKIILCGPLYGSQKFRLLRRSLLFLNASYDDPWCISMCEAMAEGCTAVAYDLPSYRYIYRDGIARAKIGNIHDFAQKVVGLLLDSAARKALTIKGVRIAKSYSWDRAIAEEVKELEMLLMDGTDS